MPNSILQIENLYKAFGGLIAINDLSMEVIEGEIHAIIGPNGAGKTTLIAQLSGFLRVDAGKIHFLGRDITHLPSYKRCALGLARSFQITSIFPNFSTLDNVALAIQAHNGHSFRFWRKACEDLKLINSAQEVLEHIGLSKRKSDHAGSLSHGEQRQLELAMAMAANPKLLLLDEPMAGMGVEECNRMMELLRKLKGDHTIVLIEHDMDAVFALADRITVLVYVQQIACDIPINIRSDPEVRKAYLGEETDLEKLSKLNTNY